MGETAEHRVRWLPEDADEQARTDLAELVRLRANLLAPDERTMLEAYLKGRNSLRQIARLTGMKPSSAWRRIRRIAKRLYASANLLCLEDHSGLTVEELAIAKDHLIRGFPIREISRARNVSYYRSRNIILAAKALVAANPGLKTENSRPKTASPLPQCPRRKNRSST